MWSHTIKICVLDSTRQTLVSHLSDHDSVVEIGIGRRTAVARDLAQRGVDVTATDIHDREVPDGVRFVIDDITDPDYRIYEGTDAIYALNLPPELHRPALAVALNVGASFSFTTLGGDQPAIPVSRRSIPGETLYLQKDFNRPPGE